MVPVLQTLILLYMTASCSGKGNITHSATLQSKGLVGALSWYGNWCGGGHGGYQDCCNGKPCPACVLTDGPPSAACLKECPAVDSMDAACSLHDQCCISNGYPIRSCVPEGNLCACDCQLEHHVSKSKCKNDWGTCSIYRTGLLEVFDGALSCWYKDEAGNNRCNGDVRGKWHVKDYCSPTTGERCEPWDS